MGALHHFKIEIVWHPRNLQERYTKSIGIAINISENLEILSSRIKPVDSMLGICESQPLAESRSSALVGEKICRIPLAPHRSGNGAAPQSVPS